jgi:hypothetical protein
VEKLMGWVFLEVLAALALAVGIVWWTMPRKPKATEEVDGKPDAQEPPPRG